MIRYLLVNVKAPNFYTLTLIPGHYGILPAFAGCGRLIRIQIEKHSQKGKQKRETKWLVESSQDVGEDLP